MGACGGPCLGIDNVMLVWTCLGACVVSWLLTKKAPELTITLARDAMVCQALIVMLLKSVIAIALCYNFFFALLYADTLDCLLPSLPHPLTKGSWTFTIPSG